MAINKKLIHFKSKLKFEEELANGNILDTSIIFILETTEIYTHGLIYDGSTFDPSNIEASIQNLLINKVDKVYGKDLSTNDYTTAEKNKLAGIASGAEVNVQSDWNITDTTSDAYIKNKPSLSTVATSGSYNDLTNKPSIPSAVTEATVTGWGFTKNTGTYSKPSTGIPKTDLANAVQTSLGKADTALQSIPSEYVTETELTNKGYATTSAMNTALDGKVDKVNGKDLSTNDFTTALKTKLEGLSNYDDTAINNAIDGLQDQLDTLVSGDTDAAIESFNEIIAFLEGVQDTETLEGIIASIEQQIAGKQDTISDLATIRSGALKGATAVQPTDLATVATSGSYNDLSNKPTIPTVNNATLTIQKNGTTVDTFTSNASSNKTINITMLKSDVGLGNVDNTSDADKPVSDATLEALDAKQAKLVSGTNIKTVNNTSLLGNGNIGVGVTSVTIKGTAPIAVSSSSAITSTGTRTISISAATQSAAGSMSAADKTKLDGIEEGANAYSLPTATSSVLGGVKVGSNISVSSGTISLTKANVTNALGYTPPVSNIIYGVATTSSDGLMSAADKTKVNNAIISDGTITKIVKVSALPSSPESTTLYVIPE